MPLGTETVLIQRIEDLLRTDDRYVDAAAQLRVYERGPTGPVSGELLPRIYGGRYDVVLRRLVPVGPGDEPLRVVELSCHRGQLPLLLHDGGGGIRRVLALGPPGGGKSYGAVTKAYLLGLAGNRTIGVVAPTNDRRRTVWDYLISIGQANNWLDANGIRESRKELHLFNGTIFHVISGTRQSAKRGVTVQGRNWDAAVVDESQNVEKYVQNEINFRGRLNRSFCVFETATNDPIPEFRLRLSEYRKDPVYHLVLKYGTESPWVHASFYEEQRHSLTEREYRERIDLEDLPTETRTYHEFRPDLHIKKRVPMHDITAATVKEKWPARNGVEYLLAQDFGHAINTTIVLKAYLSANGRDREWWAVDEIITHNLTAEEHALEILKRGPYRVGPFANTIVVADPHHNQFSIDTPIHISDYRQFAKVGFEIHPASGERISVKHRVSMMNALLRDAAGVCRFYLLADEYGRPRCQELAKAFEFQENDASGRPEAGRKDHTDLSHPTAACGYGVYRHERIRGVGATQAKAAA